MGLFSPRESEDAREDRMERDRVRRDHGPDGARRIFERDGTRVPKGEDRDSDGYDRTGWEDYD